MFSITYLHTLLHNYIFISYVIFITYVNFITYVIFISSRATSRLLSRAWQLNCGHACAFGRVDEAVSGGKPPAGKGVVGLLGWHGSHFRVCITFCKVRHGDSVTKPDYYYYYFICELYFMWSQFHMRPCQWINSYLSFQIFHASND